MNVYEVLWICEVLRDYMECYECIQSVINAKCYEDICYECV